jgi:hypothetical protein
MIVNSSQIIKADQNDLEAFRILCVKRKKRIGAYLGELISAEVRKQIDVIRGK